MGQLWLGSHCVLRKLLKTKNLTMIKCYLCQWLTKMLNSTRPWNLPQYQTITTKPILCNLSQLFSVYITCQFISKWISFVSHFPFDLPVPHLRISNQGTVINMPWHSTREVWRTKIVQQRDMEFQCFIYFWSGKTIDYMVQNQCNVKSTWFSSIWMKTLACSY